MALTPTGARARALAALVLAATTGSILSGCSSLLTEGSAAGAGVAGAGVAGALTSNASATAAIGLGVNAAALAGVKALEKHVHGGEQDVIAAVAGPLGVGAAAPWSVSRRVSIERNEHGMLTVSRLIQAGELDCKEVVFSVDATKRVQHRSFYVTTICRDGTVWRWASAEPATTRWGALQ